MAEMNSTSISLGKKKTFMSFLSTVLDRLHRENLHGPISPFSQEYRQKKQQQQQQQQQDDWQFVSSGLDTSDDDDLDAKDPR